MPCLCIVLRHSSAAHSVMLHSMFVSARPLHPLIAPIPLLILSFVLPVPPCLLIVPSCPTCRLSWPSPPCRGPILSCVLPCPPHSVLFCCPIRHVLSRSAVCSVCPCLSLAHSCLVPYGPVPLLADPSCLTPYLIVRLHWLHPSLALLHLAEGGPQQEVSAMQKNK